MWQTDHKDGQSDEGEHFEEELESFVLVDLAREEEGRVVRVDHERHREALVPVQTARGSEVAVSVLQVFCVVSRYLDDSVFIAHFADCVARVALERDDLARVKPVEQENGREDAEGENTLVLPISPLGPDQLEHERIAIIGAHRGSDRAPRVTEVGSFNLTAQRTAVPIDQVAVIAGRG